MSLVPDKPTPAPARGAATPDDPHYSLLRERVKQFRELHPTEIEIPEFCNWLLGYLDGFEMAVRDALLASAVKKD